MILIFGGTTEGRVAARVCEAAAKPYFYSSKNGDQELAGDYLKPLAGGMDAAQIRTFCAEQGVDLIIDAAHPFASLLHRHIAEQELPIIRLERPMIPLRGAFVQPVAALAEAMETLPPASRVLALTGVKSAPELMKYRELHEIKLRIMDREDSHQQVVRAGFPQEDLLYYPEGGESAGELTELLQAQHITTMICKDSGQSGGLIEKMAAAEASQCQLFVIQRPSLPAASSTVYGAHGLRRAIQQLLPDYFTLKTGLTTGSFATAASCAALYALLTQSKPEGVSFTLPDGEVMQLPVHHCEWDSQAAYASFIKDSGDDPCVIHGLELGSRVRLRPEVGIILQGGEGVGRATLPGLDFLVGEAAINKVPRAMILDNIQRLMKEQGYTGGVTIEIIIPRGEEAAKKTLNSRLGIVGGLSILGTSGIVQPYSAEAFLASIERQLSIVKSLGHSRIAINSGAKSEQHLRRYLPELDPICLLHYGNLVGGTLELCAAAGMQKVHLGLMIGKAVKLAQGAMDTHNSQCRMDKDFLTQLARESQCGEQVLAQIVGIHSARELWDIIPAAHPFFHRIAQLCHEQASQLFPSNYLQVLLIAEGGNTIIAYE